MDITKAEQIALDDALVAPANRLKIANVPKIYMQEFWATTSVHSRSIRFKMNNKKHTVNLEYFREMLQICPIIHNQKFDEPPFEQEILTFLVSLDHSGEMRKITDVNANKLHQPWRSFAMLYDAILPKELTNEDIRNSESYKEYYAIASGEVPLKIKASVHKKKDDSDTTPKEKPPTDPKDKRVKQTGKMTVSGKQKQPATGLETLSEIALIETEQLKITTY
ncbi:hypothetical protein Tco_0820862 [Tanacetum coccineum]|uniref:Uncharacterized protein n=1 Tax=Tanacetum coccineum TaxID=301880 RepID=A0ABQ5ABK2_9ASTR